MPPKGYSNIPLSAQLKVIYVPIAIACIVMALIFCYLYFMASMEAKAFNRITGSDVTAWEAMWVNLRVDVPTSENRR